MTKVNNLLKQEDEIDQEIIGLLEKRRELTDKVAKEKIKKKLSMNDPERSQEVLKNVAEASDEVDREFIKKLYKEIMGYCGE